MTAPPIIEPAKVFYESPQEFDSWRMIAKEQVPALRKGTYRVIAGELYRIVSGVPQL